MLFIVSNWQVEEDEMEVDALLDLSLFKDKEFAVCYIENAEDMTNEQFIDFDFLKRHGAVCSIKSFVEDLSMSEIQEKFCEIWDNIQLTDDDFLALEDIILKSPEKLYHHVDEFLRNKSLKYIRELNESLVRNWNEQNKDYLTR